MTMTHNLTEYSFNDTYFYYDGEYINIDETSYFYIYSLVQILSITCYSITILLGLPGNGLVIWISGFKMKTVSAVWFLNLAIIDFISCLFLILRVTQRILEFPSIYYFYVCNISLTALFTNMVTSVNFLILISLDRCISVLWPLWAKIHRTKKLAWILSGFMWLLNIVIFFLQISLDFEFLSASECFLRYYLPYTIRYKVTENVVLIVRNICIFAIPFLIISVSYGLILSKIRTLKSRRSPRPFMIIATILICFFVCWFPYHAWTLVSLNHHNWKIDLIISEISTILAFFNCAINPILYFFLSKGFKKNFVKSIPNKVEMILSDPGDYNDRNDENNIKARTNALDTSV
ncbi:chemerin-like receptor 1 [Rhinoderma darwinii]|uniref:chemerin-like receptor 1 n=1 Tax=Rhinoderma darwinii TaxID=43563 RepID=UPI003F67EF5F